MTKIMDKMTKALDLRVNHDGYKERIEALIVSNEGIRMAFCENVEVPLKRLLRKRSRQLCGCGSKNCIILSAISFSLDIKIVNLEGCLLELS